VHKTRITEKITTKNFMSELGLLCDILQELSDLSWDLQGDIDLNRANEK
jgi:hypothetical protein